VIVLNKETQVLRTRRPCTSGQY